LLQVQRLTGPINELLINLIHRRPALEQQVAAQLQLEHRILIGEAAALLFFTG